MPKHLFRIPALVILIIGTLPGWGQKLELYGRWNINMFRDRSTDWHYITGYATTSTAGFGVGMDSVRFMEGPWRFGVHYDWVRNNFKAGTYALGGSWYTRALVDKHLLSISAYPVMIRLGPEITSHFGIEYAIMLAERFEGIRGSQLYGAPPKDFDLQEEYYQYSRDTYFGILTGLDIHKRVSDKLVLIPRLVYYHGLSYEFREFPNSVRASRFTISLAARFAKGHLQE
jgi:hypothetical protein